MEMSAKQAPAIQVGEIDWPGRWRVLAEAREAAGPGQSGAGGSRWEERAERFAQRTRSLDAATDPFVAALREVLRPTDTVLDVGAGAGRYSMPIAAGVARITAVEPSAGMRAQLVQEAAARGLSNVTIVPSSWEAAEVEAHDIAFVANVLYFVPDAVRFIEKLDRHARRACFVLHRLEERVAWVAPVWEEIWGRPRPPEPSAIDLFNLLFSMGIRANLTVAPRPAPARYATLDEALAVARQSLGLPPNEHAHDARIEALLEGISLHPHGPIELPPDPQMAVIWWSKPGATE